MPVAVTMADIAAVAPAGRPLVICDVDEVAFRFVVDFERYIEENGYRLDAVSYGLTGNIKRLSDGVAVDQKTVGRLLNGFFADCAADQEPVEGAAEALAAAARRADIVMLSNLPEAQAAIRAETLARHGMPYPLVANTGPKGPAVAALSARARTPIVFLDDSPTNLVSVRDGGVATHIVHFIADLRFARLAGDIAGIHLRTSDWAEAAAFIDRALDAAQSEHERL